MFVDPMNSARTPRKCIGFVETHFSKKEKKKKKNADADAR